MTDARAGSLEPAYLLHRRAFRDTSLLIECFTRDHGRVGLVARGARRQRSSLPGVLQPFQPLNLSWRGRGELGTLHQAEIAGPPRLPRRTRLVSAFYANELLMRVLAREDPHPELFDHYTGLITALTMEAGAEAALLRLFERDLLASLGYGLQLTHDIAGYPLERERLYRYDLDAGPRPLGAAEWAPLPVSGAVLLGIADGDPEVAGSREARDLMRAALRPHIGDRPLRSRELYRRQQRGGAETAHRPDDTDTGDVNGE
ncbi:DNA repair protein RecO [Arhodomonas sp. AD133]|uniref:DNA repair protein RecO n=1 Tax=Arhodomonas sp. AD133 TaxID=3415009 RepID=UPI003EC02329